MGADQFFLLFSAPDCDPSISIRQSIGGAGYIVDQSDSWAMVRLTGPNCRAALERICSLDLDPGVFPPGRVARTVMEHLSVIILCETDTKYTLLSPRSSAGSFMHALDTSARNVE
jgi:sarcosine oxidase subunit gamma